jgi:hypothetical protein
MWRNKTPQRALARLVFCVARAAEGGEAVTVLLHEVLLALILPIIYLYHNLQKIIFEINVLPQYKVSFTPKTNRWRTWTYASVG